MPTEVPTEQEEGKVSGGLHCVEGVELEGCHEPRKVPPNGRACDIERLPQPELAF